jgi:hypothetical protein
MKMCEFISWKEIKTKTGTEILFLTHDDIYNTSRGLELQKHTTKDDFVGHGAIAFYYQIDANKGTNKECTDFSTPDNFPPEIVAALKSGRMWGMVNFFPKGLLRAPLYADYEAKCDTLYADYKTKRAPLDADYEAKRAPLDADYEAKRDTLYADYEAKSDTLYADYKAKRDTLYADYKTKRAPLDFDYEAKRAPLDADYKAKRTPLDDETWGLFIDTKNRADAWK